MIKRGQGCDRETFAQMQERLIREEHERSLNTSSDANLYYQRLVIAHKPEDFRAADIFFQRLSTLRRAQGKGAVVRDEGYVPDVKSFTENDLREKAYILRATDLGELNRHVTQAVNGSNISYRLEEW